MTGLIALLVGGWLAWTYGLTFSSMLLGASYWWVSPVVLFVTSVWWLGPTLLFVAGFGGVGTLTAMIGGGFRGTGLWSSTMLRRIKGLMADSLVWPPTFCLMYFGYRYLVWTSQLYPTYSNQVLRFLHSEPVLWLCANLFVLAWAVSLAFAINRTLKIIIGRITRPFRRLVRSFGVGLGGSSKYLGMLEEWCHPWQAGRIFLGGSLYNPRWRVGIKDDRHLLTMATNRAGKGTSCIIPNLMTWDGSAIVIDPKGENAAVTARRRGGGANDGTGEGLNQDVYIFDPFNELADVGLEASCWNPLDELDLDAPDIVEQIENLASAMVIPDPHGQAYFENNARDFLAGLIVQCLTDPHLPQEERHLGTVRDWAVDFPPELQEAMNVNTALGGLARKASRIMGLASGDSKGDIRTTVLTQVNWLSSVAMRNAISRSDFSLKDIKRRPMTVYIVLPTRYIRRHARIMRIFIEATVHAVSVAKKHSFDTLFLLDEFYSIGYLETLDVAAGAMAGNGIKLWPIVQNIGQLKTIYKENWETFMANAGMTQVFAVNDESTARWVSDKLGHHVVWRKMRGGQETSNAKGPVINEWVPMGASLLRSSVEFAKETSRESGNAVVFRDGDVFLLRRRSYDRLFWAWDFDANPYARERRIVRFMRTMRDLTNEKRPFGERVDRFVGSWPVFRSISEGRERRKRIAARQALQLETAARRPARIQEPDETEDELKA